MPVGRPIRLIRLRRLVAPSGPTRSYPARKEFEVWTRTAPFDNGILLVRFAAMFSLAGSDIVDLCAAWPKGACVLAANTEKQQLRNVAKIETDPASIAGAVLAELMPNYVGFVAKPPGFHHLQPLRQQGIRHPKIEVRGRGAYFDDRKRRDGTHVHGAIAAQALVFRRHLSGAIDELPRRVSENATELALYGCQQLRSSIGSRRHLPIRSLSIVVHIY